MKPPSDMTIFSISLLKTGLSHQDPDLMRKMKKPPDMARSDRKIMIARKTVFLFILYLIPMLRVTFGSHKFQTEPAGVFTVKSPCLLAGRVSQSEYDLYPLFYHIARKFRWRSRMLHHRQIGERQDDPDQHDDRPRSPDLRRDLGVRHGCPQITA